MLTEAQKKAKSKWQKNNRDKVKIYQDKLRKKGSVKLISNDLKEIINDKAKETGSNDIDASHAIALEYLDMIKNKRGDNNV